MSNQKFSRSTSCYAGEEKAGKNSIYLVPTMCLLQRVGSDGLSPPCQFSASLNETAWWAHGDSHWGSSLPRDATPTGPGVEVPSWWHPSLNCLLSPRRAEPGERRWRKQKSSRRPGSLCEPTWGTQSHAPAAALIPNPRRPLTSALMAGKGYLGGKRKGSWGR